MLQPDGIVTPLLNLADGSGGVTMPPGCSLVIAARLENSRPHLQSLTPILQWRSVVA